MFVVDFETPEGSIQPVDDADATVTVMNPEQDKTSYHEETVITEEVVANTETANY